jgi:PTH1 family peptidyl-tRNA hydrolase
VHRHVLNDFAKAEREDAAKMIDAVAEALPILAGGDENGFMNKVSVIINPPQRRTPRRPDGADAADRKEEG